MTADRTTCFIGVAAYGMLALGVCWYGCLPKDRLIAINIVLRLIAGTLYLIASGQ